MNIERDQRAAWRPACLATALRTAALIGLVVAGVACAPATIDPSEASPSPTSGSNAKQTCDPTVVPRLIAPDGSQVVLGDGGYGESTWIGDDGVTYHLRQAGECVWITGFLPAEVTGGDAPFLTSFLGRLGSDFRVVGRFADLTGVLIRGFDHGDWTYSVTFEGGNLVMVEDRTDGGPPGCTGGEGPCPELRSLRRLEDLRVSSESFEPAFTLILPHDWGRDGNAFAPPDGDEATGFEVVRDWWVLTGDCSLALEPGVGPTADDFAHALADTAGLEVTGPVAVNLGGLSGQQLDISLSPNWTSGCPYNFGEPTVTLIGTFDEAGANAGFLAIERDERYRFIALDGPDGMVLVGSTSTGPNSEAAIEAAMRVIASLDFGISD